MPYQIGASPNRVNAMEFVISNLEDMRSAFEEVLYAEHVWKKVVPEASIDTSVNAGATALSYGVEDWRGSASWRGRLDQTVPTVGQTVDKILIPMEVGGCTSVFDREDARQAMFGMGENLLTKYPQIMRKACENHVEATVMFGDTDVGFAGWLDYPTVGSSVAPNGAGGTADWPSKTDDEILADVNAILTDVWIDSEMVHLADTLYLSGERLALLNSRKASSNANMSLLKYIRENNLYTNQTGGELNIVPLRYLDAAGAGSTQRMVAADSNPDGYILPFPIPFELLDPQQRGYGAELLSEYKFGSFHVKRPLTMKYLDGI